MDLRLVNLKCNGNIFFLLTHLSSLISLQFQVHVSYVPLFGLPVFLGQMCTSKVRNFSFNTGTIKDQGTLQFWFDQVSTSWSACKSSMFFSNNFQNAFWYVLIVDVFLFSSGTCWFLSNSILFLRKDKSKCQMEHHSRLISASIFMKKGKSACLPSLAASLKRFNTG